MSHVGYTFNEAEAKAILELINEKMASIFCQPIRKVRFVFLSYISGQGKGEVVVGQCVRLADFEELQICVRLGWQRTAIHELAHAYNPGVEEKRIKEITIDIIKYLKVLAQQI